MTRFFSIDHAYEDAWNALPHSTPDEWFRQCFGTADFLDVALRAAGHEAMTHFTNGDPDYQLAIANFKPDVIISTAASRWGAYPGSPLDEFRRFNQKIKLVLFCSHKVDDYILQGWDVIFSSFRWMPEHCRQLGVKCEYLPLAFGRPVLDRIGEMPKERDIPVAFIGGLGSRIWDQGTKTMAAIAEAVPSFQWHGYVVGSMGDMPIRLQQAHRPAKYGLDYYRLLARTKICVNRHGEISRGSGNNMRQWESHGMRCCLLTDEIGELGDCPATRTYKSPDQAVKLIREIMNYKDNDYPFELGCGLGRDHIWLYHTYESRVPRFLEVVESI